MTKIIVQPYFHKHLLLLNAKSCHAGEVPEVVRTEAVTVLREGEVLAIFGAFWFVPGVRHLWGLVSVDACKYPIGFYKISKQLLAWQEKQSQARRLQIDIRANDESLIKWADKLGFQQEGLMKKFGQDGSDYFLYARTL